MQLGTASPLLLKDMLEGIRFSPALQVYCTPATVNKHQRAILHLSKRGCFFTQNPAEAMHKILAGKAESDAIPKGSRAGWWSMSAWLQELRKPVERAA